MNHASAKIIASSTAGDTVVASAARISTTQGTALEVYARSCEKENNASLIEKVVASGHTSTLEHQIFTVAFDNVSVCTEEFVIEFRLGSYTVKSRRYVDFTNAGFYIPPMPDALMPAYQANMQALFDAYAALLERGIPKEDARYLLPYCFRSNFYCTMNARELMHMIEAMLWGRGSVFPELKMLGESLKTQFAEYFPHLLEKAEQRARNQSRRYALPQQFPAIPALAVRRAEVCLSSDTPCSAELLCDAAAANGMILPDAAPDSLREILCGERPRELELLHTNFEILHLSLAAITHLVRHRMQTVLVPQVTKAALLQTYVLPETIRNDAEAYKIYTDAFTANAAALRSLLAEGLPAEAVQYFALAGNQLNVICGMNGRELLHFMKLRTCNRAQWEIRDAACDLLRQLRETENGALYALYGPSCYVTGGCPEGRLTCGRQHEMKERFSGKL